MRELRLVLLAALVALPLAWSATFVAETRAEMINHALSVILLGTLPLLGVMLYFETDFRGADSDVRYGQSRHVLATKVLLRTTLALLAFALLSSWICLLVMRGFRDSFLLSDLLSTAPIALAASICISSSFAMVKVWLGRIGLGLLLLLSWFLGPLDLPVAALVPTGHVRYLLGIGAELPLPLWASFICLYVMAGVALGALFARVPR